MLKSSGALAAATMTSRVFGLVREIAYARFMGADWVAGAFVLAFMIPNLFRRLLGEGALTAAFIPVFKEKEKVEGDRAMWQASNAVVSALTVLLTGIVCLVMALISVALALHGFEGKTLLMLQLLRLMFPYVLLVCLAALFMAILNARGHFFIPALGSTLLNLVLIASVFWLAPRFGTLPQEQIVGLAVGVLLAGVAQALFQLPLLRKEGFRYRWITPWMDPTVRRVLRQMIPGTVGVAAYQINVLCTNGVAFWVDDHVVASFNYAVRLMELPQGVFGLSLASFLLPTLSGLAAEKNYEDFRKTLGQGVGYLVFVNLLAAVILLVLAEPMIRLLFERGRFDSYDTMRTARALAALAPGLVAFSGVNVLARAFYALGDIRTPMRISIFCLGLNLILVLGLVWHFKEVGMGIANSFTAFINVGLLIFCLRKKLGRLDLGTLKSQIPGMAGAALVAGCGAYFVSLFFESRFGHATYVTKSVVVFGPMMAASLIYLGVTLWLRLPYAREMMNMRLGR